MAEMIFFTKTGCTSSEQQKTALNNAGNHLECYDILSRTWTRESLLPFVRGREVLQIMDCSAPAIRTGEIDPLLLSWEDAVNLMIAMPVLIKGPLVQVDNLHIQGAADTRLKRYIQPLRSEKKPGKTAAADKTALPPRLSSRRRRLPQRWYPMAVESFA